MWIGVWLFFGLQGGVLNLGVLNFGVLSAVCFKS